jgi:hypothetical protein
VPGAHCTEPQSPRATGHRAQKEKEKVTSHEKPPDFSGFCWRHAMLRWEMFFAWFPSKVRTTARNNQWEFHWETMRESCFTGFVVFKFQFLHSAFGCRAMHFRQHQSFKFTILGYRAQSPPSRGFFHAIERRESSRGASSFTPSSVENRLEGLLGRCNRGRRWSMAPLDSSRLWRRARGFDLRRV